MKLIRDIKFKNVFKIIGIMFSIFILIIFIFSVYVYINSNVDELLSIYENSYSTSILDNDGKLMDVFLNDDEQWHIKIEGEVPDNLKEAVLCYEDKNFYKHNGVDYLAILRAFKDNMLGKKRSGASTITMQVAKLAYPKKRTYFNKIKEIIFAIKLENNLSKNEILKLYLNNAPYGGNIIGYGTASNMYFKKDPINLSWAECALLAVLPNSPGAMNFEKNREKLIDKRNKLLDKLYDKNLLDKQKLELSKREAIPSIRYSFDRVTPHLARRLNNKIDDKVIHTTIDYDMQIKMNDVVKNYSNFVRPEGIENISLLIIDNKTRNVKTYIGSQDFMDMENAGQVDGIIARRSPGSILKPFLFSLSIDEGLIAPESLVQDVPMYFSNFNPQNASKKYTGMIEIKDALISSLNIPFVHLLQQYGEERFYYFLKDVLEFSEDNPSKYGLSLILGTKEFSPEEIGILYSGLANMGNFKKLNYVKDAINTSEKNSISKGVSYLTLNTLRDLVRPGLTNMYKGKDPISWKTGTSFGKKDAWACGVTPDYTVVTWVGNFSGKGNDNLSGSVSAGRLLFNVFQELNTENRKFEFPKNDLREIEVDKLTGYRVEYEEIEKKKIYYPTKAKPLKLSPYYKKVYVDDEGKIVDSRDESFVNSKYKIIMNYPLEVVNYYIRENKDISKIYNINTNEKSLKILYPTPNLKILLPKDLDKEQNLIIKIANLKNQDLYWYLDKEFIDKDKSLEKEIPMGIGKHILTLVSEEGEKVSVSFEIEKTY